MTNKDNKPLTLEEIKTWNAEQIAECVKIIDSWTSEQLKENCKDAEFAEVIEYILSQPPVKKEVPKAEPKAKFKPPVRTQEEQAIENMSADEMKGAFSRGRGAAIESILSRRKS